MMHKNKFPLCYKDSTVNQVDLDAYQNYKWLTSEAINFFFEYIMNEQYQSEMGKVYLMNPSCYQVILFENDFEDLKDSIKRINLPSYKYIITPVNDSTDCWSVGSGNHWALLVFDVEKRQFIYFDSSNGFIKNASNIASKLMAIVTNDEAYMNKNVDIKVNENTPKQRNSFDCGMYAISIAEVIVKLLQSNKGEHIFNNKIFGETITPDFITQKRQTIRSIILALLEQK